jgi:flagellar basal-body rod modification protein FlgD
MTVSSVNSTSGSTGAPNGAAANPPTMDYNSFLTLLITEMKNQDPTQPMDSTAYVAQLATFSQLGQQVQTNAKLDQMLQAASLSQAGSIIGHTITSADGQTSGTVSEVRIVSDGIVAVLADGSEVPVGDGVVIQ